MSGPRPGRDQGTLKRTARSVNRHFIDTLMLHSICSRVLATVLAWHSLGAISPVEIKSRDSREILDFQHIFNHENEVALAVWYDVASPWSGRCSCKPSEQVSQGRLKCVDISRNTDGYSSLWTPTTCPLWNRFAKCPPSYFA